MHVVVVGGTGLIGSRVVNRLRDHGAEVAVGSLRTGIDAYSGRGLVDLFRGADVVVDATNMNRPAYDYEQAHDFFARAAFIFLVAVEDIVADGAGEQERLLQDESYLPRARGRLV